MVKDHTTCDWPLPCNNTIVFFFWDHIFSPVSEKKKTFLLSIKISNLAPYKFIPYLSFHIGYLLAIKASIPSFASNLSIFSTITLDA